MFLEEYCNRLAEINTLLKANLTTKKELRTIQFTVTQQVQQNKSDQKNKDASSTDQNKDKSSDSQILRTRALKVLKRLMDLMGLSLQLQPVGGGFVMLLVILLRQVLHSHQQTHH